jgi:hypothetical protein
MNTLASVIWGPRNIKNGKKSDEREERKVNGVVGTDFLYPVMNNMLPSLTDCSDKNVREIGQDESREIACWLFELSGLFLTHSDFLASKSDQTKISKGQSNNGEWPVENVFVGKKEPDLADAIIAAGILIEQSSRTPDSSQTIHYYRVNEEAFSSSTTISGNLNVESSKCLQKPIDGLEVKWLVSLIEDSNALLLVVDGYRRKGTGTFLCLLFMLCEGLLFFFSLLFSLLFSLFYFEYFLTLHIAVLISFV